MPIYTVEHNGKVFDIEGPAGASPEQLQAVIGSSAPSAINSNATAATETASAQPQNTLGQESMRQLGLAGRAGINALMSPLTLGGDAISKAANTVVGREVFQPSSRVLNKALTSAGFPAATRPLERFTQDMAQGAPALAIPGGFAAQTAGNALIGGIQAPAGKELEGAQWGAVGGALGHFLPNALSKGLPGVSKEARQLMDSTPIQPTVGMAVPKLRALEEFTTGIPILGEATKAARSRAISEFSTEALSRAVPTMPKTQLKGSPFEQIDAANDHVSSIFYDVLPKVKPEAPLNPMGAAAGTTQLAPSAQKFESGYVAGKANSYLSDAQQEILDRVYKNHAPKISSYTGEQLKTLDAELGEQIRKYQRGAGTSDLADSLAKLQLGLREGIEARLPQDVQGVLAGANKSYRELLALNEAASKTPEMLITPRRLAQAMSVRDKKPITKLSGDTAEFVRNAEGVIPNSAGTRGVSAPGMASALAGTGLAAFMGKLPVLFGVGAAGVGGATRPVQSALTGNLALQRALRAYVARNPSIAPAIGASVMSQGEDE